MDHPLDRHWSARLGHVKDALEANNFEVHLAASEAEARQIVLERILPPLGAKRIARGGSLTVTASGLVEAIRSDPAYEYIDVFETRSDPAWKEERQERMGRALLADAFLSGTNAVTEEGQLVNLDMIGNRVAGIAFGPKAVVILAGRNKVVENLEAAISRIKRLAAPANAVRLDKKTPCAQTSFCEECKSSDRICNVWTITEKSYPKGRIKVVLINKDLGL